MAGCVSDRRSGKDKDVEPTGKTATLLSFARLGKPEDFSACRDLLAYWEALRGPLLAPARMDFDPRGIESVLSHTFVAERVAPRVARIRVAGSRLNDALGMDVRGMPITAFFDPHSRDAIGDLLIDLFARPARATLDLSAARGFVRKAIAARAVLLPMSDANGELTRLVGCFDTGSFSGAAPSRYRFEGCQMETLHGSAPQPMSLAPPAEPARQLAFAEAPAAFRSARSRRPAQPYKAKGLRLVVDNG